MMVVVVLGGLGPSCVLVLDAAVSWCVVCLLRLGRVLALRVVELRKWC